MIKNSFEQTRLRKEIVFVSGLQHHAAKWESTVNPTRCRGVIGIKYESKKVIINSPTVRLKRKAKFWTIHTINSDYKTRVMNKHNH